MQAILKLEIKALPPKQRNIPAGHMQSNVFLC